MYLIDPFTWYCKIIFWGFSPRLNKQLQLLLFPLFNDALLHNCRRGFRVDD